MNSQDREAINELIDTLATRLRNKNHHLRAARTAEATVAAEAARVREAAPARTDCRIPQCIIDFEEAAKLTEGLVTAQMRVISKIETHIADLRKVRDNKHARLCPECGLRTLTLRSEQYYNMDRCAGCDYFTTIHSLVD